jgi:peptidylprolyl isomerase
MKKLLLLPLLIGAAPAPEQKPAPAPSEIVAAAPASDWVAIAASDLLVMDLPALNPGSKAGAGGKPRRVVIQLMPPPFSQGWISNIRKLAAAKWWDGTAIVRVQDNYVTQWGDPDGEDPKKAKALPKGLVAVAESDYVTPAPAATGTGGTYLDSYSQGAFFSMGWPLAWRQHSMFKDGAKWPVHCYGMVGVGRGMSPDTGSGAELYTVIGHAPRHLDRNIALVGRVIEGMEHLSSLPRGTGPLGFYEKAEERTPITSIRMGTEVKDLPVFQYLNTDSKSFAAYADARANRRDPFFIRPAGGADICNIPVPVRRVPNK